MRRAPLSTPLTLPQLEELIDHLGTQLEGQPCDQTTRHVQAFCRDRGLDVKGTLEWLKHRGGWCDCEVWLNAL